MLAEAVVRSRREAGRLGRSLALPETASYLQWMLFAQMDITGWDDYARSIEA